MALRTIRHEGDALLRKISKEVKEINGSVITLLDDMLETMQARDGIGLAAPQVGVLKRIFIIDGSVAMTNAEVDAKTAAGERILPIEFINPEIIEETGEQQVSEGCLSVPKVSGSVLRPAKVTVKATDRNGNEFVLTGYDLLARAICHELDHLNGILFIDKIVEIDEEDEYEDDETEFED